MGNFCRRLSSEANFIKMAIQARIQDITTRPNRRAERIAEKNAHTISKCDACIHCNDSYDCIECDYTCRHNSLDFRPDGCQYYTMCQIRRHNNIDSAWLVVGDKIYDATEYIHQHPGGEASILKKAGGACDCAEDFKFHSKRGRKVWDKYFVGKVKPCPASPNDRQWWMFWM